MKLCKSNVFVNKVFLNDPEPTLNIFGYEAMPEVQRVVITGRPEVTIQNFGDHFYIEALRFESEKQFNSLVLEAIIRACHINNNVTNSMAEGLEHFEGAGVPFGWMLVSKEFGFEDPKHRELCELYLEPFILRMNGLNNNQILLTPQAEFLGVIAVGGDNLDKYAVGIANTTSPILVELP